MSKIKLDFTPRVKLRIREIEETIRRHRIIVPCPSRQTLIAMCEDGTFETVGNKPTSLGYLVYEDSFVAWLRKLDNVALAA